MNTFSRIKGETPVESTVVSVEPGHVAIFLGEDRNTSLSVSITTREPITGISNPIIYVGENHGRSSINRITTALISEIASKSIAMDEYIEPVKYKPKKGKKDKFSRLQAIQQAIKPNKRSNRF